jgi:type I site-specific restriction-modification system R (restriction) subunit
VDLNPDLPSEAIELTIEDLTRDRSIMSPANANREVYRSLKNGVKVSFRGKENEEIVRNVLYKAFYIEKFKLWKTHENQYMTG